MKFGLFIFIILFSAVHVHALEGFTELSKSLVEKNQEMLSLEKNIEAKQAFSNSSNSIYYPTLNAVGGWGQYKTDDLPATQKGYLGYIEGKFNLFRGFKDQSIRSQKQMDFEISKIDLEVKKRQLRLQLTDVVSDMIYLHKIQSILDEEYKVTQTQKQMAAKKVAAGLTGSVDKIEFELRENELQIEQKQVFQKHQEVHQKMIQLYGEDVPDSQLAKLDFSNVENLSKVIDTVQIENTLEYKKADLIERKSVSELKEIKSDFLPSLDLTYSAGRLTPLDEIPIKFNESKYAIQLTIPLFSGFETYYKKNAAAFSLQSAEKLKLQKKNDVVSEFQILKTKIAELGSLFQINEKKLINSQKYFDLTLAEYRRGVKNSPDLVSSTERLFSAKKKKYDILKELELAKVKIENFN